MVKFLVAIATMPVGMFLLCCWGAIGMIIQPKSVGAFILVGLIMTKLLLKNTKDDDSHARQSEYEEGMPEK